MDRIWQRMFFIKPYNTKIAKRFLNDNLINTKIQKTSKNYNYNLINVTNILHKSVEALTTSRLTLALPT